jgi:hypothetical protein
LQDPVDLPQKVTLFHKGLQVDGRLGLRLKDMHSLHGSLASARGEIWARTEVPSDTATSLPGQDEPPAQRDDFFTTPEPFSAHETALRRFPARPARYNEAKGRIPWG